MLKGSRKCIDNPLLFLFTTSKHVTIFYVLLGIHLLSGCWKSGKTHNFVGYLKATGVPPMMAQNIAKNKKGSIAISFQDDKARIVTITARGWTIMGAKVAMNYTNVKADNTTMYDMPLNMLPTNTNSPDSMYAIFATNEEKLVSNLKSNKMTEKWVHIPTQTESISLFDKVQHPDSDPYCSTIAPMIPFRQAHVPRQC